MQVTDAMEAVVAAVRPYALSSAMTLRQILALMPEHHIAHSMFRVTCKCEACGAYMPLSQVQWNLGTTEPECERCGKPTLVLVED